MEPEELDDNDIERTTAQAIMLLAKMMHQMMERRTRNSGEQFYCFADNAPKWMQDVCFAAHNHGEYLPDDGIYDELHDIVTEIMDMDVDYDEDDIRDTLLECEADCYTSSLTHWLASDNRYIYYIDQAFEEGYLGKKPNGFEVLTAAQKLWKDEIRNNTYDALLELAEDAKFMIELLDS